MPILATLTKALPYITTAWSLYAQSKNKPKKEDYLLEGGMYQRYITHLKSKTAESTAYHQRMRPALRQIGAQTQRGQRQVGYQVARDRPGGGVEAQMRMGINRQALEAIGIASEKASFAQERENVRTGEQLMRIGIREEYALQRYQADKRRFNQQMFTSVVSAGLNLANVAVKQHVADTKLKMDAAKDAAEARDLLVGQFESAKAEGLIDQGASLESYVNDVETAGYEKPKMYNKYMANIKAQEVKDIKFQKDVEIEKFEGSSFEALRQFTEQLETLDDPKQAYTEFDKVKDFMTLKDKNKALTKVESTFPDLVYDDPLERKIAVAETAGDIKSAEKNLTEAVETGTIDQITKAGDTINAINSRKIAKENFRYTQETRQTAKDKKVHDAKVETIVLRNNKNSLIEYFALGNTRFPASIPGPMGLSREKFYNKFIETAKAINTDKGMDINTAAGLKKAIRQYVSFIEIDSQEEKNALAIALKLDEDWDRWEELTKEIVGVDAKQVSAWALEIMKRIDALFNKMPYEPDFQIGGAENDPLGIF